MLPYHGSRYGRTTVLPYHWSHYGRTTMLPYHWSRYGRITELPYLWSHYGRITELPYHWSRYGRTRITLIHNSDSTLQVVRLWKHCVYTGCVPCVTYHVCVCVVVAWPRCSWCAQHTTAESQQCTGWPQLHICPQVSLESLDTRTRTLLVTSHNLL